MKGQAHSLPPLPSINRMSVATRLHHQGPSPLVLSDSLPPTVPPKAPCRPAVTAPRALPAVSVHHPGDHSTCSVCQAWDQGPAGSCLTTRDPEESCPLGAAPPSACPCCHPGHWLQRHQPHRPRVGQGTREGSHGWYQDPLISTREHDGLLSCLLMRADPGTQGNEHTLPHTCTHVLPRCGKGTEA